MFIVYKVFSSTFIASLFMMQLFVGIPPITTTSLPVINLISPTNSALISTTTAKLIFISVDGLRSDAITALSQSELPNFYKFRNEGAITDNARTDYDYTVTLPNHTSMVTGRRVTETKGHNWKSNTDPLSGQTIHSNKGGYVAGIFDVVHDNGFNTAMYASKSKFSLFDVSYNSVNGALDKTGENNGRDKIDFFVVNDNIMAMTDAFIRDMQTNLFKYSFLHYADPDTVGHASGWDVTAGSAYLNSVKKVDTQIGKIFSMIQKNSLLNSNTIIILTADHGGSGTSHDDPNLALDYTIPFYVWGEGIPSNTDLYTLNAGVRQNPSSSRPDYSVSPQPIRNGDASNFALSLLGLPAISGSGINSNQDLRPD